MQQLYTTVTYIHRRVIRHEGALFISVRTINAPSFAGQAYLHIMFMHSISAIIYPRENLFENIL